MAGVFFGAGVLASLLVVLAWHFTAKSRREYLEQR